MRSLSDRLALWWRRPVKRTRGLVVIDASDDPQWTPLTFPTPNQTVPGGVGSRAGVALCTTPAPSMRDAIDRYAPLLFGMQAARVPAPTAHMLTTLRKEVPHGFAAPQD